MHPITIKIYGDFFDCQIYSGRFYLWTFDGRIKTYQWASIVSKFIKDETDRIALTFSFIDCRAFYEPDVNQFFQDRDFFNLLKKKFRKLQTYDLSISESDIEDCLISEQDVLNDCLPIDTEIYNSRLYYAIDDGLYSTKAYERTRESISLQTTKLWDNRLLAIKASNYGQMALSAGNDGLFEYQNVVRSVDPLLKRVEPNIFRIAERHSQFANYSNISIYNSTKVDESCMALFKWTVKENEGDPLAKPAYLRNFSELVNESDIFDDKARSKLSWGFGDKIYRETDKGLDIVRFNSYLKNEHQNRFEFLRSIEFNTDFGEILSGGISYFGTVLEFDKGLLVELSNQKQFEIAEPITKWRLYPRSKSFSNQLHVILDNRVEVISFNHDFFINQKNKVFGAKYNFKDIGATDYPF